MGRKHFITRLDLHPWEYAAGYEAFPRLFAGAGARQPGETASRLLRIIPPAPQNPICWEQFMAMKSMFSPHDFVAMVSLYMLNIDLHLLQIARSRACRDFDAVSWKAEDISRMAEKLGAVTARSAAQRLEQACLAEDYTVTYGLISALSQACREADTALNDWLASNPAQGA